MESAVADSPGLRTAIGTPVVCCICSRRPALFPRWSGAGRWRSVWDHDLHAGRRDRRPWPESLVSRRCRVVRRRGCRAPGGQEVCVHARGSRLSRSGLHLFLMVPASFPVRYSSATADTVSTRPPVSAKAAGAERRAIPSPRAHRKDSMPMGTLFDTGGAR